MRHRTTRTVPVVVVEEQELFRGGLRTVLEDAGFTVVGEHSSAAAALEKVDQQGGWEPGTVVLCSLTLAGWQELVHHLLLQAPGCPILGVVDEVTEEVAIEALSNGVLGCVDRTLPPEQWIESIRAVRQGKLSPVQTVVRYPGAARHALMVLSQPPDPTGLHPLAPVLGHRERLALGSISEGIPLEVLVERMGVPEQAVHEVLESACRKLVARHRLSGILERVR